MIALSSSIIDSQSFFLPHHEVWKEASTRTKLRSVFNGSAQLKSGISLNSLFLTGANLTPNLFDFICQWCSYKYVFSTDLETIDCQIWVHPEDHKYQSILWCEDSDKPIQILHLTTVTYGLACSAYLASRTLKQLAEGLESDYPLGSHALNQEL